MSERLKDASNLGFTLAELLIALVLLSLIAIFTIPKILQAEQDGKYNAMGKEAVSTVAQAYAMARQQGKPPITMAPTDLIQYLNYVRTVTTAIDDVEGYGALDCASPQFTCVKLHNGGVLWMDSTDTFGGNTINHAIYTIFDADGTHNGSITGRGKALEIVQYYNGRVTTGESMDPGTLLYGVAQTPGQDPAWFLW